MKSLQFSIRIIILVGQLFFNLGVNAQTLADKEKIKRMRCTDIEPKLAANHLEDCSKGNYKVDDYAACVKLEPKFGPDAMDKCLAIEILPSQKSECAEFRNKFMSKSDDPDCMSKSIEEASIKLCFTNLAGYTRRDYENDKVVLAIGDKSAYAIASNSWTTKQYYKFLENCYNSKPEVIKTCFKNFHFYKPHGLEATGECLALKISEVNVKPETKSPR